MINKYKIIKQNNNNYYKKMRILNKKYKTY